MTARSIRHLVVRVQRGRGDDHWLAEYEVPVKPGQSVLGVLQYIYDRLDSTLAFSCSCRIGLCSGCLVRVNGKVVKACTTLAEGDLLIEPYDQALCARDLVAELPSLVGDKVHVGGEEDLPVF